jgi:hypothetical protein
VACLPKAIGAVCHVQGGARLRQGAYPRSLAPGTAGLTLKRERPILPPMNRSITIDARWDGEAAVWIATSNDVPGLVVEAEHWDDMITEVRLVLPDLLELSGQQIH